MEEQNYLKMGTIFHFYSIIITYKNVELGPNSAVGTRFNREWKELKFRLNPSLYRVYKGYLQICIQAYNAYSRSLSTTCTNK